jgi:SAM-dependent methyltransferase
MQQVAKGICIFLISGGEDAEHLITPGVQPAARVAHVDRHSIFRLNFRSPGERDLCTHRIRAAGFLKIFENCWIDPHILILGGAAIIPEYFQLIAEEYDTIGCSAWNSSCYEFLAMLVRRNGDHRELVLDFGCGTGTILETVIFRKATTIYGYDPSDKMRAISSERGLLTLNHTEFNALTEQTFDLILSCYVLHYGISESMFVRLVSLIKAGGHLVANMHKDIGLPRYVKLCEKLDRLKYCFSISSSPYGSVLLIKRLQD